MRLRRLSMTMFVLLAAAWGCAQQTAAQQTTPAGQGEDVIRVNTTLVQTDVMVFDKQGTFVENLKRDQFVLKIDGKPREISFFEQVRAGSRNEEAQLAAARGSGPAASEEKNPAVPLDRGRTIFFFVDDMHMAPSNLFYVRKMLLRFIDHDLGQNDEAAIVNASGSIGFLQQITNSKVVLRAAVDRIKPRPGANHDIERPPMAEYQALQIDRGDLDTLGYFVDQFLRDFRGVTRATAEDAVRLRASQILRQSGSFTTRTLSTLEGLMRSVSELPGRKLVFFLTDGFFIDTRHSDTMERIRAVTAAAGRSSSVIYSIDSRGLIASTDDPSVSAPFDLSGRLTRGGMGEIASSQDAMNALARDTGGRAFFNNNSLSASVATALKESSTYYLLAWRPESDDERAQKFRRIEVSIVERPSLAVRFRSGFATGEPSKSAASSKPKPPATPRTSVDEVRAALGSAFPRTALPVSLTLNFLNLPDQGPTLATSLKIRTDKMVYEAVNGTRTLNINLAGVLYDAQGKAVSSFSQHVTLKPNSPESTAAPPDEVFYNHFFAAKPGLYQVRVAALDEKQHRAGSAAEWIDIPDLTAKALTLSSLLVGERRPDSREQPAGPDLRKQTGGSNPLGQATLNVDHRFARSSYLRFLTFVYNASAGRPLTAFPSSLENEAKGTSASTVAASTGARNGAVPDIAVQVQVFRDDQPVLTDPLHKISTEGIEDLTRLPYAAELDLRRLKSGRYVLQVTVIDRLAKTSAFQRFNFEVD